MSMAADEKFILLSRIFHAIFSFEFVLGLRQHQRGDNDEFEFEFIYFFRFVVWFLTFAEHLAWRLG